MNQTNHIKESLHNRTWLLPGGIYIQSFPYDDLLYAFQVTQNKICLGTIIPQSVYDMYQLVEKFEQKESIDGLPYNDEFGTIIHCNQTPE